jgi:putative FmdB family regulatory protein
MPIYEYRCAACRRNVTVLTLRVSETVDPVCERCGSRSLTRLMSRFAMVRSGDARLDDLSGDDALGDVDESDPKSMARWMRKMGDEFGEDAGGDFDEMVDGIERGDATDEGADGGDEP